MTNVLLTSGGRRSYLVRYFKQAIRGSGRVICANMYADTPAMCVADEAVVVPPSSGERYLPAILELCRKYEIRLLCSLHDLDTYILSQHLNAIRQTGAVPMLPSAEWGRICLDKYLCGRKLEESGIAVPWTEVSLKKALAAIEAEKLCFPVIVKPRFGFGSFGLQRCNNIAELKLACSSTRRRIAALGEYQSPIKCPHNENLVIQQAIKGNEYCVDIVNDLRGHYACHFVCRVHAMRGGETDQATTVDPKTIGDLPRRLSELTAHPGIWGVDVMDDDGVMRVIDINPRFTGDYPFHHIAGANVPAAAVAWAEGDVPNSDWLRAEVGVRGYKDLVPTRLDPL